MSSTVPSDRATVLATGSLESVRLPALVAAVAVHTPSSPALNAPLPSASERVTSVPSSYLTGLVTAVPSPVHLASPSW